MQLTISGYSTALFATWYFVEELGILLDAGDGLTSALLQKSRKIQHVFISHADRDHLTGLLQLNQLNARPGYPVIWYPRDCTSFPRLEEFSGKFDAHVQNTIWHPISGPETIYVKDDIIVQPVQNGHVAVPPEIKKSFGYKIIQTRQKLKPELTGLPGTEIKRIIEEQGRENTYDEIRIPLVNYSGDSPVEDWSRWDGSDILIHEATFLESEGPRKEKPANKHSTLEQVMEMAANISIQKLVLGHFSTRYSPKTIDDRIRELCVQYGIQIPVYRVLPGATSFNILSSTPINS